MATLDVSGELAALWEAETIIRARFRKGLDWVQWPESSLDAPEEVESEEVDGMIIPRHPVCTKAVSMNACALNVMLDFFEGAFIEVPTLQTEVKELFKMVKHEPTNMKRETYINTAVAWLSSQLIALGDGRGLVQIFRKDAETLTQVCRVPRDDVPGRIKSLLKVDSTLLVGLSTGQVEVWSFDTKGTLQQSHFKKLRVVDTKSRLTCLAVWAPGSSEVAEALAGAGKAKRAGKPQTPKTGELPVKQKATKAEKRGSQSNHT